MTGVVMVEARLPSDYCLKVGWVMPNQVWHVSGRKTKKIAVSGFRVVRIRSDFGTCSGFCHEEVMHRLLLLPELPLLPRPFGGKTGKHCCWRGRGMSPIGRRGGVKVEVWGPFGRRMIPASSEEESI